MEGGGRIQIADGIFTITANTFPPPPPPAPHSLDLSSQRIPAAATHNLSHSLSLSLHTLIRQGGCTSSTLHKGGTFTAEITSRKKLIFTFFYKGCTVHCKLYSTVRICTCTEKIMFLLCSLKVYVKSIYLVNILAFFQINFVTIF